MSFGQLARKFIYFLSAGIKRKYCKGAREQTINFRVNRCPYFSGLARKFVPRPGVRNYQNLNCVAILRECRQIWPIQTNSRFNSRLLAPNNRY